MINWLSLVAETVSIIFPNERTLKSTWESATGCPMKGDSLDWRVQQVEAFILPLFQPPSAGSYRRKISPLELPGDSLASPGWALLGAGFGFGHPEQPLLNFGMQASCPQRGKVEHLPFSLAAPPLMVSPQLV